MGNRMERLQEKYGDIEKYRVVVSRTWLTLTSMQVCCVADATDEEILQCCNTDNPSGTSNGWVRVIRDGEAKPGPCEKYPERLHVVVVC